MPPVRHLRYLGQDTLLLEQLNSHPHSRQVRWKLFDHPEELLEDCHRSARQVPESISQRGDLSGEHLAEGFAPVLLDLPDGSEAAVEVLRELKAIHHGIPAIVLGEKTALTTFSLHRLEGAEAFFHKPVTTLEPIWEAIERANRRVLRWITTIEETRQAERPV